MKISNSTKSILKNFSTINSGIKVEEGNRLKTISNMKNILAVADVSEEFPVTFSIYNLSEFLGATSLMETPEYDFGESSVMISDTSAAMKYHYASEGMVVTPEKLITMPECEIKFVLEEDTLNEMQKASSVLGVTDLVLERNQTTDNNDVYLVVRDKKNPTSNSFSRKVEVEDLKSDMVWFNFNFKIENLKILPATYTVSVASVGISHFESTEHNVQYFIALEPDSKFG